FTLDTWGPDARETLDDATPGTGRRAQAGRRAWHISVPAATNLRFGLPASSNDPTLWAGRRNDCEHRKKDAAQVAGVVVAAPVR
ncbi:MAG: hypothetical protein ACLFTP_12810, partial [Rhodosalinus sp.]